MRTGMSSSSYLNIVMKYAVVATASAGEPGASYLCQHALH
jgi:hypothetical protein